MTADSSPENVLPIPPAPILPGATIGMLGGGQLGRMFTMAAARLGYRVAVFAQSAQEPACRTADSLTLAPFEDLAAVGRFASACDVVTLEFENVPLETMAAAAAHAPTRPSASVLGIAQDRLAERAFLDKFGIPTAAHAEVRDETSLRQAIARVGRPCVLKTARFGYDGRGQAKIHETVDSTSDDADLLAAWKAIGTPDRALCEAWMPFRREVSVLVARTPSGDIEAFGPIENRHKNHILDVSTWPCESSTEVSKAALDIARTTAAALELEGILCVEMFEMPDGTVVVNEIAPRPHNSGHLTMEACWTSQFEQQLRAVCGLPLSKMAPAQPAAAMVNLLGDLWGADGNEPPPWADVLCDPKAKLHLYDKTPRPGRKMGHLTVTSASPEGARKSVQGLFEKLSRNVRDPRSAQ